MRRAAYVGLVVALASLRADCSRKPGVHLAVLLQRVRPVNAQIPFLLYRVWSVDAHGQVVPFPYAFPKSYIDSAHGSTVPVPSPDGRWIAFGDSGGDHDAHLLDVDSLRQHRITRLGKPATFRSVSIDVLLDGWSPDSRRLLLYVTHGEDASEEGELKVPAAGYGFYEYDVVSGKISAVSLPKAFEFVAWLRDGRFVGVIPGHLPHDDELVTLRPGDAQASPVGAVTGWPIQAQVSANGKWLVGLHADDGQLPGQGAARIVRVNLKTMAATPLVSLGSWSGNERPALSADGSRLAYRRDRRRVGRGPQESLFVNGKQMYACPGMIDFRWVGRRMIALACQDRVAILDADTGIVLSRRRVSTTSQR